MESLLAMLGVALASEVTITWVPSETGGAYGAVTNIQDATRHGEPTATRQLITEVQARELVIAGAIVEQGLRDKLGVKDY